MRFGNHRLWLVATVTAASVVLAACSSSSKGSSGSPSSSAPAGDSSSASASVSSTAGSSKVPAEVLANVNDHTKAPVTIHPTDKIGKAIPKGKNIVYINCGAQACTNIGNSFQEAVKVLGWNWTNINTAPTPQAIQNAFQHAVDLKPDAVVTGGFGIDSFSRQLAELKALNIPVLSQNGPDKSGNGLTVQITDPEQEAIAGRLLADKMIVDQNGEGLLGLVTLTGYPTQETLTQSVKDEITKNCSACTTKTLSLAPTAIGTTAASQIASFLRANPTMKEIYLSYDDLANGLKAAVANAGISYPKSVSWAPTQNGIQALQSGDRTAAVGQYENEIGWQYADALARIFTGQDPKVDEILSPWFLWGKEYNNVPTKTDSPDQIEGFRDQFKTLWGIS